MLKKLFQLPSKLRQKSLNEKHEKSLLKADKLRQEIAEEVAQIMRERGEGCYHPETDQRKILKGEVPFTYFD